MVDRPLTEPTADEARNGWTAEKLTAYLAEQDQAAAKSRDPHQRPKVRPRRANSKYQPLRWRG